MRASLMALLLVLGCSAKPVGAPSDASTSDAREAAVEAAQPVSSVCPRDLVELRGGDCVPSILACDADAGTADPTCLPDGLRSAALAAFACPAGWRRDPERGCIPTLRTDCPAGSGPLPNGTCTDTASCPESVYPEIPAGVDPTRTLYVDDDAPAGGDGARDRPLRDLSEAFRRALDHGAILVAAGEYPVYAEVHRAITLRGVCPSRVRLRTLPTPPEADLLLARGANARLAVEGISAETQSHRLVGADQGGRVTLRRVTFRAQRMMLALVLQGGTIDIEDVYHHVDDPPSNATHPLVTVEDSSVILRRSVAMGGGANLVRAARSPSMRVEDCAVVGAQGGIYTEFGTALSVDRLAVVGLNRGHGIWVHHAATTLRDISIENTAVRFALGADVTLARLSGHRAGIEVYEPDTRLRAVDVAMTDVRVQPDRLGSCLVAERAARVEMQRGRFIRCNDTAIYAVTGASMTLEDLYVRDARPNPAGFVGIGFTQALGGSSTIRRAIFDHAGMAAIVALHLSPRLARSLPWEMFAPPAAAQALREPSRVTLEDVVIQNGETIPEMPSAGLFGGAYSEVRGTRVSVLRQSGVGILSGDSGFERQALAEAIASAGPQVAALLPPFVDGASSMHLDSLFVGPVRRARIIWDNTTRRSQPDFVTSYGAIVSRACDLSLVDAHFEGGSATETALVSQGTLTLRGGVVRGTTRCAITRNGPAGAVVSLDDVILQGNAQNEVCNDETIPLLRLPMSPN